MVIEGTADAGGTDDVLGTINADGTCDAEGTCDVLGTDVADWALRSETRDDKTRFGWRVV